MIEAIPANVVKISIVMDLKGQSIAERVVMEHKEW